MGQNQENSSEKGPDGDKATTPNASEEQAAKPSESDDKAPKAPDDKATTPEAPKPAADGKADGTGTSDAKEDEGGGTIDKETFQRLLRVIYKVVKDIVLSSDLRIEKSIQLRRMELGEIMEVVEGPAVDPS